MTEATPSAGHSRRTILLGGLAAFCILALLGGGIYVARQGRYVFTDDAEIQAPLIQLSASAPGTLKRVYVQEGDSVHASQTVAFVGGESVSAETDGLVVEAKGDIGALYQPGQPVVTMIREKDLRIVARVDEDKGLRDIYEGQKVEFTVDAFGGRVFRGTVETVVPTKNANDVVFSISDKRETKQFDVKIRYEEEDGVRFRNGMSARVWIIK